MYIAYSVSKREEIIGGKNGEWGGSYVVFTRLRPKNGVSKVNGRVISDGRLIQ